MALRHGAQPGDLALGKLARCEDTLVAQFVHRPLAVECFPGLAVTHATHGRQVGRQVTPRAQGPHLVYQPRIQHGVKALRDTRVQPGAVRGFQRHQWHRHQVQPGAGGCLAGPVKTAQRTSRHAVYLQRTLYTLAVLRRQARGGKGVHPRQLRMFGRPALRRGLLLQPGADGRVGRGHIVQPLLQRLEVQHAAAHQQRQLAALVDLAYQTPRIAHKLGCAIRLQRVADVDQVVRHRRAFGQRGFGRADVHAAVDQRRVHTDDFHRVRACYGHGRRRLSRGGGAGQRKAPGFRRLLRRHALAPHASAPASSPRAQSRYSRTTGRW